MRTDFASNRFSHSSIPHCAAVVLLLAALKTTGIYHRLSIIVILILFFTACSIGISGNMDSIQIDDVSNADKISDKKQRIALLIHDLQYEKKARGGLEFRP